MRLRLSLLFIYFILNSVMKSYIELYLDWLVNVEELFLFVGDVNL